jgi:hypothetical protein
MKGLQSDRINANTGLYPDFGELRYTPLSTAPMSSSSLASHVRSLITISEGATLKEALLVRGHITERHA